MTYSRTAEKIGNAKLALMEALKAAQDEKLPVALVRQIDTMIGRAEHLQVKIQTRIR